MGSICDTALHVIGQQKTFFDATKTYFDTLKTFRKKFDIKLGIRSFIYESHCDSFQEYEAKGRYLWNRLGVDVLDDKLFEAKSFIDDWKILTFLHQLELMFKIFENFDYSYQFIYMGDIEEKTQVKTSEGKVKHFDKRVCEHFALNEDGDLWIPSLDTVIARSRCEDEY